MYVEPVSPSNTLPIVEIFTSLSLKYFFEARKQ